MVTRTKRNRGTGCASRNKALKAERQDPPWVWGSNLGGIPLGKERPPAPKHGTGVLIKTLARF